MNVLPLLLLSAWVGLPAEKLGPGKQPLTERRDHVTYIEEITFLNQRREVAVVRTFTPAKQRITEEHYVNYDQGIRHGLTRCWYPNGQTYWSVDFKHGDMHGPLLVYHPDGTVKRRAYYKRGLDKENACFDAAGGSVACKPFTQAAAFRGSDRELASELNEQFEQLNVKRIDNGRYISVRGIIEEDGSLTNVSIYPSDHELAEPFKKAIAQLPRWQPALVDDQVVATHYTQSFLIRERDIQVIRLR